MTMWGKDILAEIQALENGRLAATIASDTLALDAMLAEELAYGHSSGALDSKAALLAAITGGAIKYLSIASKIDHAARISADLVIASGWLTTCAEHLGKIKSINGRYMAVWRNDGTVCQLVALQGSAV